MVAFKIGDKVMPIHGTGHDRKNDIVGTIICTSGSFFGVEFDEDVNGHDCDGMCEHGYGWFHYSDSLRLIKKRKGGEYSVMYGVIQEDDYSSIKICYSYEEAEKTKFSEHNLLIVKLVPKVVLSKGIFGTKVRKIKKRSKKK